MTESTAGEPVTLFTRVLDCREGRVQTVAVADCDDRPEGTVYVGDEYDVDVLGAIGAGLRPVWLSRETPDPVTLDDARSRGVPVVSGLGEVAALIGL